jgi:hypothetical protein
MAGVILPGLWHDLGERFEKARNWTMRTVLRRFASLNEFEARVTSQNGEDGIVAEIFRRIGTTNRYFVEFGVGDGHECNTAQFALSGWSGLMLEGNPADAASLAKRYASFGSLRVAQVFITAENIASIFESHGVSKEFDIMSIDVDGNDYWIWRARSGYRPRVVVIEYNSAYPPPRRWVMRYNPDHRWDKTTYYGASLSSFDALGKELGYSLLGTDVTGVNAFFVRHDVLRASGFRALDAARAYHPPAYYGIHHQIGHVPGDGPGVEI